MGNNILYYILLKGTKRTAFDVYYYLSVFVLFHIGVDNKQYALYELCYTLNGLYINGFVQYVFMY